MSPARLLALLPIVALACGGKPSPRDPHTYHAIAGVSMGAVGAAALASANPGRFDAVGALGGPLDAPYLLRNMERYYVGGFCPLAALEAKLAAGADLDDPGTTADCVSAVAPRFPGEHVEDFNHWLYTDNAPFTRDSYLDLFEDLSLAYGNPIATSAASPMLPPGVSREALDAATCANGAVSPPITVHGLLNAEYNPDGKYDAIAFCDGGTPWYRCGAGGPVVNACAPQCAQAQWIAIGPGDPDYERLAAAYQPCAGASRVVRVALAYDLNGNGRRDYGEPIVVNPHERFQDVGADGCPDPREDGHGGCLPAGAPDNPAPDPNGDDYDPLANPLGTEGDFVREAGEPFDDLGLDGVAGTADAGEGNGAFDVSPQLAAWLGASARRRVGSWSDADLERVSWYVDGGIRDVFDFGIQAAQLVGALSARLPAETGVVRDFPAWPGASAASFDAATVDLAAMPRNLLFLYGDPTATPAQIAAGDGDHVGTIHDVVERFHLLFRWLGARWPGRARGGAAASGRLLDSVYRSTVLGADRDFTIELPPGYSDGTERYPVVLFLHGYGQDASSFGATGYLFIDAWMASGEVPRAIVVYPSGRCCFTGPGGARACTEHVDPLDASSDRYDSAKYQALGWKRECRSGTFYADRSGYGTDTTPYGRALLELMDHVDANWRTLMPARR